MPRPTIRQAASCAALTIAVSVPTAAGASSATSVRKANAALVHVHEAPEIRGAFASSRVRQEQASPVDLASWISHMGANPTQPVSC